MCAILLYKRHKTLRVIMVCVIVVITVRIHLPSLILFLTCKPMLVWPVDSRLSKLGEFTKETTFLLTYNITINYTDLEPCKVCFVWTELSVKDTRPLSLLCPDMSLLVTRVGDNGWQVTLSSVPLKSICCLREIECRGSSSDRVSKTPRRSTRNSG